MLTLQTSGQKIQVVLSGAKSSADCPFSATYEDVAINASMGGGAPLHQPFVNNGKTNGATAVDVIPAYTAIGVTRRPMTFNLFNADNASVTPTVQMVDSNGSVTTVLTTLTLQVGETLLYESGNGWRCLDTNGNEKTNQPASSGASSTALSAATSAGTAASTASSQAVSAGTAASTASSQAASGGTAASTADSKGVSAATIGSTASSNQSLGSSAGWSVSISKVKSSFGF